MRRVLLFITIFLALSTAGWYFFLKSNTTTETPSSGNFKKFFPVNDTVISPVDQTTTTNQPSTTNTTPGGQVVSTRFTQLTGSAVAGYTVFNRPLTVTVPSTDPKVKPTTETIIERVVRYVSRPNGYVYEIKDEEVPLQISNIYLPNIYEASFADNNKTAILRFLRPDLRTIATYSVPIPDPNPDNSRTQKAGVYLPNNLLTLAMSPDQKQLLYVSVAGDFGLITASNSVGTKKSEVFRSPLREWLLSWPIASTIYLQTKPSASVEGFLYAVSKDKILRKVIGNIPGLTTTISPSGGYVLYSQTSGSGFTTKLFNSKSKTSLTIPLSILPEKCTWLASEDLICAGEGIAPNGAYPDDWYAGVVSFSDNLYKISKNGTYTTLYTSEGRPFDMTNLKVNESANTLYFTDKPTGILWKTTL